MNAAFAWEPAGAGEKLALSGEWTVWTIAAIEPDLAALSARVRQAAGIDVSAVSRLDVAGAHVIERLRGDRAIEGAGPGAMRLFEAARLAETAPSASEERPSGLAGAVHRIGVWALGAWRDALATLSFLGESLIALARVIVNPGRLRMVSVFSLLEVAGFNAIAVIAVLSFFVGLVIAYVGLSLLGDFGAAVFTVELVGLTMMREFAVVITAILLAGRTDSAFTAEIGAMKMRQEIDAMRVLGLDVMERLVVPRIIAMTLATPMLTFVAMLSGLLGGLIVTWTNLGVSPVLFLTRIQENVGLQHFVVGLVKAPVFGFCLAIIGCMRGLRVGGDVASLGAETTRSVVQAIFTVIVLDAMFALWFLEMGW